MYDYKKEKRSLNTDEGQKTLLSVYRNICFILERRSAVLAQEAWQGVMGESSWTMLACLDRLVELKLIREVTGPDVAGQHRVFVR